MKKITHIHNLIFSALVLALPSSLFTAAYNSPDIAFASEVKRIVAKECSAKNKVNELNSLLEKYSLSFKEEEVVKDAGRYCKNVERLEELYKDLGAPWIKIFGSRYWIGFWLSMHGLEWYFFDNAGKLVNLDGKAFLSAKNYVINPLLERANPLWDNCCKTPAMWLESTARNVSQVMQFAFKMVNQMMQASQAQQGQGTTPPLPHVDIEGAGAQLTRSVETFNKKLAENKFSDLAAEYSPRVFKETVKRYSPFTNILDKDFYAFAANFEQALISGHLDNWISNDNLNMILTSLPYLVYQAVYKANPDDNIFGLSPFALDKVKKALVVGGAIPLLYHISKGVEWLRKTLENRALRNKHAKYFS